MTMNRVQFQHGMSLPEFISRYGAEAQSEAAWHSIAGPVAFSARVAARLSTTSSATARASSTSAAPADTRPR